MVGKIYLSAHLIIYGRNQCGTENPCDFGPVCELHVQKWIFEHVYDGNFQNICPNVLKITIIYMFKIVCFLFAPYI